MRIGQIVDERFRLDALAGTGGMGEVYRATDLTTQSLAAVKFMRSMSAELVARFAREGSLLAGLQHEGIVGYLAHGVSSDGHPFLAMQWLDGEDLAARLTRGALPLEETLALARPLADALAHAHARGLVHRDLKPANVFLADRDVRRPRLLDFGIARQIGHVASSLLPRATGTGASFGTPGYMAPEQARAARNVDARADVFSFGCILFECLVGTPAFAGENVMAILAKILLEDAPRLRDLDPGIPSSLDALVAEMLAKDAAERPLDGAAVRARLDGITPDGTPRAVRVSRRPLSTGEQLLVSVVAALLPREIATDGAFDATITPNEVARVGETLDGRLRLLGARIERLANGTLVAAISGEGGASALVARAAEVAIELHARFPDAPIALATGRAEASARMPAGEAIDRVAALVADATRRERGIRLDALSADLLRGRFRVESSDGFVMRPERMRDEVHRVRGKSTPCVGRERELGVLAGAVDECVAEPRARAVIVQGQAGTGKSRLREEFVRKLVMRDDGFAIWSARAEPLTGQASLAIVAQLIRAAVGIRDGNDAVAQRARLDRVVTDLVGGDEASRVSLFLAHVLGVHEGRPAADGRALADQIRIAWTAFVTAFASTSPVAIVVEDLHWSDRASRDLLGVALESARDLPLLVAGFTRPDLETVAPNLWSAHEPLALDLGPLSRKACEKVVRAVLGETVPAEQLAALVETSGGHPFLLEELLRAGVGSEAAGDRADPSRAALLVQSRLEALEPESRRVARAAAVLGETFWRGGVAALLGEDGGRAADASLETLVQRELVTRQANTRYADEPEYRFRHAIVRDAAYAMLTDTDRVRGHRLAAEWLRAQGESDDVLLAEHYARGEAWESAADHLVRAARTSWGRFDHVAARDLATRALDALEKSGIDDPHRAADAWLVRAQCAMHVNDEAEAARTALEAHRLADERSATWIEAVGVLAMLAGRGRDHASLARWTDALVACGASDDPVWCDVAARIARLCAVERYDDLAAKLIGLLLPLVSRPTLDPVARFQIRRANAVLAKSRQFERVVLCEESLPSLRTASDPRLVIGALVDAAIGLAWLGAADRALAYRSDLAALGRRLGDPYVVWWSELLGAVTYFTAGEFGRALELSQRALGDFSRANMPRMVIDTMSLASLCAIRLGRLEEAEQWARTAAAMSPQPSVRCVAIAPWIECLLLRGALDEALPLAREFEHERCGNPSSDAEIELAVAEVFHRAGDTSRAKAVLRISRARLDEELAAIGDDPIRTVFLAIPAHRALASRYAAWLDEDGSVASAWP